MPIKRNIQNILALMVTSAFFFQGCATIVKGTSHKIPVTSNPIGAKILVDGNEIGYTPLGLKLAKNKNHIIRAEKQGYNPLEIRITQKFSGILAFSILGNALIWGSIGAIGGALAEGNEFLEIFRSSLSWLFSMEKEKVQNAIEERSNRINIAMTLGFLLGTATGIIVDFLSGANYALSPAELNVTLIKIEGKLQPHIIVMDSEQFQNIRACSKVT